MSLQKLLDLNWLKENVFTWEFLQRNSAALTYTGLGSVGAVLGLYSIRKYFAGGKVDPKWLQENLNDKVAIITGGNSGIGYETAKQLYRQNAIVVMAVRDTKKGEDARNEITREFKSNGRFDVLELDLGDLNSVRQFADQFKQRYQKLHYLINNAGIMVPPHNVTKQNFEIQFGVNHLGHFLLTQLLLDMLKSSGTNHDPARIINVSSLAHENAKDKEKEASFHRANLVTDCSYMTKSQLYNRSKLANVLFTKSLQKEFDRESIKNVVTYTLHPGVIKTNLARHISFKSLLIPFVSFIMKTPYQGAQTTLHVTLTPTKYLKEGGYYADCKEKPVNKFAEDQSIQETLWKTSFSLIKDYMQ